MVNKSLEQTLQESRDLHTWIFRQLDGVPLPITRGFLLSIAAFDVVLDYCTGITALIEKRENGSAVAVVR